MNYFRARKAERLFRKYKELALAYWSALPNGTRHVHGYVRQESDNSLILREKLNLMFPEVNELAHKLGVTVIWQSLPPPSIPAQALPVNMLLAVIDPDMGYETMQTVHIVDVIDRAIGAATIVKLRAFWRMVVPFYWLIDIPAFCIRLPFIILRKAGLPEWVEQNIVSQVIKILLVIAGILLLAYLGLEKYAGDVLKCLGK